MADSIIRKVKVKSSLTHNSGMAYFNSLGKIMQLYLVYLEYTAVKWRLGISWIQYVANNPLGRNQWPRGLKLRSASAHLLELQVRISPEAWKPVSCECWVFSGRGLCDKKEVEILRDIPVWVSHNPPQIPHRLFWERTLASAVRNGQLNTRVLVRPHNKRGLGLVTS